MKGENSRQKIRKKLTLLPWFFAVSIDRGRVCNRLQPCGPASRVHVTRREFDQQAQSEGVAVDETTSLDFTFACEQRLWRSF